MVHRCGFCRASKPTARGIALHIQNSPSCRRRWEHKFAQTAQAIATSQDDAGASATVASEALAGGPTESDPSQYDVDDPMNGDTHRDDPVPASHNAHVEDVPEDEEQAYRYVEAYPGVVATIIREDKTLFERWRDERAATKADEWKPFQDQEEWELFAWLAVSSLYYIG